MRVLVSNTEFGQGTNTILTQIAAEAIGIDYDDITMAPPDTGLVPNSGPTVASRTSMVVGRLIERAGLQLVDMLRETCRPGRRFHARRILRGLRSLSLNARRGRLLVPLRGASGHLLGRRNVSRRSLSGAYAWSVHVAQVAVDTVTYSAEVEEFWACRKSAASSIRCSPAGQIEGGIAQGIGYALYEKVVWQNGHMANNQMTNYIMPTAEDVPPIHVFFEEIPFPYGASAPRASANCRTTDPRRQS